MRTFASLALLVLATGCSGIDAREPMPPGGVRSSQPIEARVSSAYQPMDPKAFSTPGRFSPATDAKAVAERANALLKERGTSPSWDATPPVRPSATRLEASITRADIKYECQTALMPLKVFFTIFFFPFDVPNYFMSSDKFACVLQAKWKLVDNGQDVAEGTAEGRQSGTFGDLSRGWYFVGYLRMPSPLKGDEWQEIADVLVPGAQDALAESLVLEVEKALAGKRAR